MNLCKTFAAAFICAAASVFMLASLIVLSIETFALNENFYKQEYGKLKTAESIGISEQDLAGVTNRLLSYTRGEADNLDIKAVIGGSTQEVFGEREKEHMVDVRALYLAARDVRTYGLIIAAVLAAVAFFLKGRKTLSLLCRSFLSVSVAFLAALAALGIWAALDFSSFWTAFHHVFFTNDLWILNPETDVLIMMVPQQFFSDLVKNILILFAAVFAVLNAAAAAVVYINKKKAEKGIL